MISGMHANLSVGVFSRMTFVSCAISGCRSIRSPRNTWTLGAPAMACG
jgi:hypothetical protein